VAVKPGKTEPTNIKRIISGTIWSQLSRIGDVGLSFLYGVLVVRALGTHDYGTYLSILNLPNLMVTVVGFGLSEVLLRYLPKFHNDKVFSQFSLLKTFLMIRLIGSLIAGAILFGIAPWLASWFANPIIGTVGGLLLLLVVSFNINELLNSYSIANFQLKLYFLVRSITQLASIAVVFSWFYLFKPDPLVPLVVLVVTQSIQSLIYLWKAPWQEVLKSKAFSKNGQVGIYKYSRDVWLINLFTYALSGQFDILILSVIPKDQVQVAYYGLVSLFLSRIQSLVTGWGLLSTSVIASVQAEKGKMGLSRYFNYYYKLSLLTMLPTMAAVFAVSSSFIPLVYGNEFSQVVPLIWVYTMFIGISVCFGSISSTSFILVLNLQSRVLKWRVTFGLINIILDIILIPPLGALGAIIATGLANNTLHLIEILMLKDVIKFFPWSFLLKMLGAVILAGAIGLTYTLPVQSRLLGLIVAGLSFSLTFGVMLLLLKPFDKADLALAQNLRPGITNKLRHFTSN